jgi:hypothetical protein
MSIFKTIALAILLIVAAILIYAATKPDTFRIERSISIRATPERIVPLIDNMHNFGLWSPYEKMDPTMQRTFSGAPSGKGAVYAWDGNSKIGQGRMEVIDSNPSKVSIKLDFFKPFEAHNTAEFMLAPGADGTVVTWAMVGPSPYFSKLMTTFFSMDRMVGGQFEEGLVNLKILAEKPPAQN